MGEHAKLFSASGSKTWMSCAASAKEQLKHENKSNEYADLGTLVHKVGDLCLSNGEDAQQYIGTDLKRFFPNGLLVPTVFPEDMAQHIQVYIDYCRAHHVKGTTMMVENRVSYREAIHPKARGKANEEGFGTADCIVVSDEVCHVMDYKNGSGVMVDVENNTQGMLYALGVYYELGFLYEFDTIVFHIVQPRKNNIVQWESSVEDLLKFAKDVTKRTHEAIKKNPPFNPTPDGCQWCRAGMNGECDALIEHVKRITLDAFDDETEIDDMSDDTKKMLLDNEKLITSTLAAVKEGVRTSMLEGNDFTGFKLIEGRSTRQWIDTAEAKLKKLGYSNDEIYTHKLIGVTAGDKLLTKEEMEELTIKPKGQPVIAPVTARGKAIEVGNVDDFDDISDQ